MFIIRKLILVLCYLILMACDNSNSSSLAVQQADLDKNIILWENSAITDYRYTYKMICFCVYHEDIVVEVVANKVKTAFYTPSGTYLAADKLAELKTIAGLHALVQSAIDSNVASLIVTYNTQYGYPVYIGIDHVTNVADDEVSYVVSNFQ